MKELNLKSVMTVLVVLFSLHANAYDVEIDGIYYKFVDNVKQVEVSGSKFKTHLGSISVIIPESIRHEGSDYSVTSISDEAFMDYFNLASIVIPNSVTKIGKEAFSNCNNLISVTLPNSVTSIGDYSFQGCYILTSITIPESVTSIGDGAFYCCDGLTSVTIPKSVTSIGSHAFAGCIGLTSVSIPNSVTSIGDYSFAACNSLIAITIPNSVTSIGDGAFQSCDGLTSVTIPNSVTSIGIRAFEQCSSLTSLIIPNSVTSIGDNAFQGCSNLLEPVYNSSLFVYLSSSYGGEFTIPQGISQICSTAFNGCTGLTSVTIPGSVTSIGDGAFSGCSGLTSVTIHTPEVSDWFAGNINIKEVVLGDEVTSIESDAFNGCSGLTSVIIPNSVMSIGDGAFSGCSGLTSVTIEEGTTTLVFGKNSFSNCPLETLYLGRTISYSGLDSPFNGNNNLTSLTIGNSVTSIGNSAFSGCSGLTSVNIPNSITSIEESTFSGCSGLTSVTIPNSVTSIGKAAFENCISLTSLIIPSSVISISSEWPFSGCCGLTAISVESDNTVYDSRDNCNAIIETQSNKLIAGCKNTFIPNSITYIFDNAFAGCSDLKSIDIPNSVTKIGGFAFRDCNSLTSITIPETVTNIEWYTFWNCSGLTSVTIGSGVSGFSCDAFSGCPNITTVSLDFNYKKEFGMLFPDASVETLILGNNVTEFDYASSAGLDGLKSVTFHSSTVSNWFAGNTNIKEVVLGDEVTSIESDAFNGCSGLTSVIILNSVMSIGDGAFSGCSGLTSVTIHTPEVSNWFAGNTNIKEVVFGEEVTSIESKAFAGCTGLTSINLPDDITKIGDSAFDDSASLLVKRGSKTLLALWSANYKEPKDVNTSEVLVPTTLTFRSSTQCTAKFHLDNIYPEYETTYDGIVPQSDDFEFTTLKPDYEDAVSLKVALNDFSYDMSVPYATQSLNLRTKNDVSITSFTITGEFDKDDAEVIAERMEFNGEAAQGNEISAEGLDPQENYEVTYVVTVRYGENSEFEEEYTYTAPICTDELVLTTLPPKVVSKGEVIVAAESNLTNDDLKVGFEWRRSDAPEELASKTNEAYLYNGTMEGILHNLTSFNYWRYRPYYESSSGKRFYGEWGIVEADDDSYFEPTVHTYEKNTVNGNTVLVKGYALGGTDKVMVQGFMYWKLVSGGNAQRRAVSIPANTQIVEASGQVMTAELKGLDYDSEYTYVAFVKTVEGDTFYGEEQTFITEEAPTGIESVDAEGDTDAVIEIARYNMNGQQIDAPQKGVNIIRYSDGQTKKVFVK